MLQVPEQRQEHLLHDFLRIGDGDAKRQDVAENGYSQLLEQRDDLFFQAGGRRFDESGKGHYPSRIPRNVGSSSASGATASDVFK